MRSVYEQKWSKRKPQSPCHPDSFSHDYVLIGGCDPSEQVPDKSYAPLISDPAYGIGEGPVVCLIGAEIVGMVYGTAHRIGDAEKQPDLMTSAYKLGQKLDY